MRMFKHSLRFYASGLAACALLACDKPEKPDAPGAGEDVVTVEGCRKQIAARQDEVNAAGIDVATWSIKDAPQMVEPALTTKQTPSTYKEYDGKYRPLTNHPGCSV
ncbi:MAG TPA: hypothetical protein VF794_11915, partial [Archangium sp.]|uniref:hypothetical protein n=1 Tax=Archangium sp. TaxID=1872627 RepID=UPI002EDB6F9B